MALKYLEFRIISQVTGLGCIGFGTYYYKSKQKSELVSSQPYGPYRHGYGKRFLQTKIE